MEEEDDDEEDDNRVVMTEEGTVTVFDQTDIEVDSPTEELGGALSQKSKRCSQRERGNGHDPAMEEPILKYLSECKGTPRQKNNYYKRLQEMFAEDEMLEVESDDDQKDEGQQVCGKCGESHTDFMQLAICDFCERSTERHTGCMWVARTKEISVDEKWACHLCVVEKIVHYPQEFVTKVELQRHLERQDFIDAWNDQLARANRNKSSQATVDSTDVNLSGCSSQKTLTQRTTGKRFKPPRTVQKR